jgi:3-isopropylmalate/(R)-2-methylmalate dehydratase small subunit
MKIKGKVWKFGDNINTDEIIPAKYLSITNSKELGRYCMEGVRKDFSAKVSKGDIIIAGKNFGCGSSREHAPRSIKARGISCVVGESFARIFYRNAINIGLPIAECPDIKEVPEGDLIEIDFTTGEIQNLSKNRTYSFISFPPFMQELIKTGGLIKWIKNRLTK